MATAKRSSPPPADPRILIVTPEITYLPPGMGNMANRMSAKAGGLADVSASLVSALFEMGADVHVALPHYRRMFNPEIGYLISQELRRFRSKLPDDRIHLAEDRIFYYRTEIYSHDSHENPKIALAFQREVINNIIPSVQPDLIHCNDWMTGLIPACARRLGIPCLFTLHNIHTHKLTLAEIEDRGIDAEDFWPGLFYEYPPAYYEESLDHNPVDLLASGIFASHFINTVSPTFLREITEGRHDFIPGPIRREIVAKAQADCAVGILNAPDTSYSPETDEHLRWTYSSVTHREGKLHNKLALQEKLGLEQNPDAPVFFWPSRLDPNQKGCQLLAHILYDVVSTYWDDGLQIAFVANGESQTAFRNIVRFHDFYRRVAVCDFREPLSRLGYAGSDFMLMPSLFEPCGLPQMVSAIYGSLPIAHDTGGLRDTVKHLDAASDTGNGFVFETYDPGGLRWAIDQAMAFYRHDTTSKAKQIERIMRESAATFTHSVTARQYFDIYERMLNRPLINVF